MTTRNQRRIREILGEQEEASDTSLRAQSLRRATSGEAPRTLTPFEWEEWYAEHGVPATHRRIEADARKERSGWWRRLLHLVRRDS
jgi:hypothetical protein